MWVFLAINPLVNGLTVKIASHNQDNLILVKQAKCEAAVFYRWAQISRVALV